MATAEARLPVDASVEDLSDEVLDRLATVLEPGTDLDLHHYKTATIRRRLRRRMSLAGFDSVERYLRHLEADEGEQRVLARDLLISVTDFFRDAEGIEALRSLVIQPMVREAGRGETLRVWVAGCATGEEAYSIAILLAEEIARQNKRLRSQIFATDVDEEALAVARLGIYSAGVAEQISASRLKKYFAPLDDRGYQVRSSLRDSLSFAVHDLTKDPPFSRMHLVSCRNVLIYLRGSTQEQVLRSLHFALNPGGHLFLGSSESLGRQSPLFTPVSKPWRIFQKLGSSLPLAFSRNLRLRETEDGFEPVPMLRRFEQRTGRPVDVAALGRRAVMNHLLAPTLVVAEDGQILFLHGELSPFLRFPEGEPRMELFSVLRPDLSTRVRAVVYKCRREGGPQTALVVPEPSSRPRTRILAHPAPEVGEGAVILTFEQVPAGEQRPASAEPESPGQEAVIEQLEQELRATREDLRNTVEELETSNEELRASNEESILMNEELQSSNEELEATSEELSSLNEELTTVNAQLREKVDQLEQAHDDLSNFIGSTRIATLFLDEQLCIKRFTPSAEELLRIYPGDEGRFVGDIARSLLQNDLVAEARRVLDQLSPESRELRTPDGRWVSRRVLPYRTGNRRIEGVVVTLVDVTDLKEATERLAVRERQQAVIARLGLQALEEQDLQSFMDHAVREIQQTLGTDMCKVLELQPGGQELLLRAGIGWKKGLAGNAGVPCGLDSQAGFTLTASGPVLVEDLAQDKRFSGPALLLEHGVTSGLSCVIRDGEATYGVLGAHSRQRRVFTGEDANFLQAVATVIAAAVTRHQIRSRLALETAVARILSEATDLDRAAVAIHEAFHRELGTAVAELWWLEQGGTLRRRVLSVTPPLRRRAAEASAATCTLGEGVLGRVARQGRAEWITSFRYGDDLSRPNGGSSPSLHSGFLLPVTSGTEVLGVVTVFSTERHFADTAFLHSLEAIGRSIGETGRRIEAERAVREQMQEASRQKDEFLAMLGHELRNPLAAARSASELLKLTRPTDPRVQQAQEILERQTAHMAKLVDGLLDVSRIVHGKIVLKREAIELASFLRDLVKDNAQQFEKEGLTLNLQLPSEPLWVQGDRLRLNQIATNLLTNAGRYTPPPGTVTVVVERQECEAVFHVEDTGQGIAPDLLPHIFEIFRQAPQSAERPAGGLGLGLPLARKLVELHAGSIEAHSDGPGRGAKFCVRLPLTEAPSRPAPEQRTVPKGCRILLVEDNQDAAVALSTLLDMTGYETQVAGDGEEALERLERFHPQAVLCDLGLPGEMSGLDVARSIRANPTFRELLLVALTGFGRSEDKARCAEAGFDEQLTKPVDLEVIERVLAKGRQV